MQVSYHGGSPLYFWPNYSLASRANPVELRSACYWTKVPFVSLSFFLASFFLRLSRFDILYISTFSLVIFFRWLRGVRYFLFFLKPYGVFLSSLSTASSLRFLYPALSSHVSLFSILFPLGWLSANREPPTCCEIYTLTVHRNNDRSLRILARPICVIVREFFHPTTGIYFAK